MGNLNNFVWTNFGSDDDEFQVFLPFWILLFKEEVLQNCYNHQEIVLVSTVKDAVEHC